MVFKGIEIRFSCRNSEQYQSIGQFWNFMREQNYGNAIKGLGYNWKDDSLCYVIGDYKQSIQFDINSIHLKYPTAAYVEIDLPDNGWQVYFCQLSNLGLLYEQIYKDGVLDYEIEEIDSDGNCQISILRV